jgi:6-phosphogluconolactonase (cycloisomerase 2 family)
MSTLSVSNITGLTDLEIGGVDIDATAVAAFNQANLAFDAANNAGSGTSYTTVSGNTISLDVSSYNFFFYEDVNTDISISFTNVPTEAEWRFSFTTSNTLSSSWDISKLYFKNSLSVYSVDSLPSGLFFKPDGSKMYVIGYSTDKIYEFQLRTPWNIETAYITANLSVLIEDSDPRCLFFKPDGYILYVSGNLTDQVYEYHLSSAWDINTASLAASANLQSQDLNLRGLFFKPDGTKMYTSGTDNDFVYEYSLSSAWSVNTASYTASANVQSQDGNPIGLFFKPDGTKMFVAGWISDTINEYSLSSAWDISTASYTKTVSFADREGALFDIHFDQGGNKLFIIGQTDDYINAYDIGGLTITLPESVKSLPIESVKPDYNYTYTFFTNNGANSVYTINESVNLIVR